jgi:hypothetical protein
MGRSLPDQTRLTGLYQCHGRGMPSVITSCLQSAAEQEEAVPTTSDGSL